MTQNSPKDSTIFIHGLLPFHIVSADGGGLFDIITNSGLYDHQQSNSLELLRKKLLSISKQSSKSGLGDSSKYYDFIRQHFGAASSNAFLELYDIDTNLLCPTKESGLLNFQAQFSNQYYLGLSDLVLAKMHSVIILLNPMAGLGFLIFGFKISSNPEINILSALEKAEFFRNIGWRQKDGPMKVNSNQYKKFSFSENADQDSGRKHLFTFYNLCENYFDSFIPHVRFYQDRLTLFYVCNPAVAGQSTDLVLRKQFFNILRVPDSKAIEFNQELTEPSIIKVGRNVIFTCLNEGAIVLESVNDTSNDPGISTANKYLPAFILAINQREVLLKTMHRVALLQADKLMALDPVQMQNIDQLKSELLIIQLKQIFYSVSNLHEVELFFNRLQQVFNIELMLKENEQSVREIYHLLDTKRNHENDLKEKQQARIEEARSRIFNTILGAIGCLGLFSFLKDFWPFIQDSQYADMYKFISVLLPVSVMAWLIWYMSDRGK